MFTAVIAWLEHAAQAVPLPLFVIVGGLIEEIIAPIPSPLVSTLAGSITVSQGLGIPYLLFICLIATLSKTFGAWLFYLLGYALKEHAVPRFGRYIGVRQQDVDYFAAKFKGTSRDIFVLAFIRSIPVMPSTPVSLLCGILQINQSAFFAATFVGFYIRNFFFMILGYTGLAAAESLMSGLNTTETVLQIVIVGGILALLAWLYWKRGKRG